MRARIGTKLAALVGGLLIVLIGSNGLLYADLAATTHDYDALLAGESAQALQARKMQVEFKKQVQEWKDVLLRGSKPADLTTYTGQFRSEYATVNALADQLLAHVTDPTVRRDLGRFRDAHDLLQHRYEQALVGFVASGGIDFRAADTLVRGQDRPPTNLVDGVVARLEQLVSDRVTAQKVAVEQRQRALLAGGLVAVAVLVGLLALVVTRISRPIRRLTRAAHLAAGVTLPEAVAQISQMPADAPAPDLPGFAVETRDELADLAGALTSMQASAVGLALEQHRRERETAEMLLNLGRRNQTLLARVLSYVSELERVEQDPDVVADLFRIDHATTRIRRNAASMLVLGGAPPALSLARSVAGPEVLRAALSEIEDYARVDLHHVEPAALTGWVAGDLSHLLAELLENATHFSPPTSRVTVVGQRMGASYRIRVIDQGIGMTREELEVANARIADTAGSPGDARLLGLHVVGRLAARHGIQVLLEPSAGPGITATVTIPAAGLSAESTAGEPAQQVPPDRPFEPDPLLERQPVRQPDRQPDRQPERQPDRQGRASRAVQLVLPADDDAEAVEAQRFSLALAAANAPAGVAAGQSAGYAPGAVPTRVRGSSLARLGIFEDGGEIDLAPAPTSSSDRLRSFQRDVGAARHQATSAGGDPSDPFASFDRYDPYDRTDPADLQEQP